VLGDPLAPRAFSLIAIHKYGIPNVFHVSETLDEALAAQLPLSETSAKTCATCRSSPSTRDARDHDDAIWAEPDGEWAVSARSSRSPMSASTSAPAATGSRGAQARQFGLFP
jgi:ribonuclease R